MNTDIGNKVQKLKHIEGRESAVFTQQNMITTSYVICMNEKNASYREGGGGGDSSWPGFILFC